MASSYRQIQQALETLHLPPLVTKAQIKAQYHHLAKLYHPDIANDDIQMQKINQAYTILLDYIEEFRYTFSLDEYKKQNPKVEYETPTQF